MTILVFPHEPTHPDYLGADLLLDTRKGFESGELTPQGLAFETAPPGLTGRGSPWRPNGDGRRFLYLVWLLPDGTRPRRLKLFEESCGDGTLVRVVGLLPDGSPACAKAKIYPPAEADFTGSETTRGLA